MTITYYVSTFIPRLTLDETAGGATRGNCFQWMDSHAASRWMKPRGARHALMLSSVFKVAVRLTLDETAGGATATTFGVVQFGIPRLTLDETAGGATTGLEPTFILAKPPHAG